MKISCSGKSGINSSVQGVANMPINCPKNRIDYFGCILCGENKEGYCWALCPPKSEKRSLKEILTPDERMSLLEDKVSNIQYLETIENLEERLASLESLSYDIQRRIQSFQETESKFNMMYDTMNNTLSKFSKKLVTLEDSKSKGINSKYNKYSI
jgi:hypothetical protein